MREDESVVTVEDMFVAAGELVGRLVSEKNKAHGDSFARSEEILRVLYPAGVVPAEYRDLLAVVRVVDKLFRVATRKNAFGESPWKDIAGYGVLGLVADERGSRDEH
jgi:hypothetical protein